VTIGLLVLLKIIVPKTSLPTTITAFTGYLEIAIQIFILSLIFESILEPDINYALPRSLLLISLISTIGINIFFFFYNHKRSSEDEYVRQWVSINLNYTYYVIFRWLAVFTHAKIFRLIYSKCFNLIHLSMVSKKPLNLFTAATLCTLFTLLLSEIPMLISCFYLIYGKILKDQLFYSSVECLVITIISILISLIDIYKAEDYFEETEFMITKRFLEKVNNDSLNKIEEDYYREKDEGSVDAEKIVGTTGGKFVFSKQEASSTN
jgi:hypothetical protein